MHLHTHFYSLALHSEIVNQTTHGLLTCLPIVQQEPDYISIIHPLCGVATIELIEGEPVWFSHPVIDDLRRTLNDFGFPLKVQHGAFYHKPRVVLHSLQLSTLLSESTTYLDNCEVAGNLVKAGDFKQRTTPKCRLSFGRQVLDTVWAESAKNRCLSNWQDNKKL